MLKLPRWMRVVMFATAAMNILGAITFAPGARALREAGGLPADGPPIYLAMIGAFVFVFGLAYLWAAITATADRLFVAVAAAGKLSFFGLLVWYWAAGALPATAPLSGMGDLVVGSLFLVWLYNARADRAARD